jgi:hypothetical protein
MTGNGSILFSIKLQSFSYAAAETMQEKAGIFSNNFSSIFQLKLKRGKGLRRKEVSIFSSFDSRSNSIFKPSRPVISLSFPLLCGHQFLSRFVHN